MEDVTDPLDVSETGTVDTPLRKRRKRIKNIFAQIRRQMEFYFSASNLHKDRFLKHKLDQSPDGYVDLSLFLSFNKIRMLSDDVTQIAKAVKKSEILQLDEEKTRIKRAKPLEDLGDVDKRTVYVESLPPSADQEWISRVFGGYGNISYISLPRYHTSGDIKGFCFVEFDTEDGATQACQMHKPYSEDQVEKPGRFPKYNKQMKQLLKQTDLIKPDTSIEEQGALEDMLCATDSLRGTNDSLDKSSHSEECMESRTHTSDVRGEKDVLKTESSEPMDSSLEHSKEVDCKKSQEGNLSSSVSITDSVQPGAVENIKPKDEANAPLESIVAKRKRKSEGESLDSESREVKRVRISEQVQVEEAVQVKYKRRRNRKRNTGCDKVTNPRDLPQLRVIPKMEWLRLKKEYLDLQKASMKNLKATLKHRKAKQHRKEERRPLITEACDTKTSPVMKIQKKPKQEKLEYIPDVIVKVNLTQPVPHTDIKTQFSPFGEVAYVDVSNDSEAYVRFKHPDGARKVGSCHPLGACKLVTGDEETQYWHKIQKNRDKMWERKVQDKNAKKDEKFQFTPNVIVKANLYHPLPRKDVKKQLATIGHVLYVDLKDGDTEGYIRCANPEGANNLTTSNISFGQFEVIQGDEEKRYWEKMQQDRDERYDKSAQRKKTSKRGVQKVVAQAEKMSEETATVRKHVIFEDD